MLPNEGTEFQRPHEWVREENGQVKHLDWDRHTGIECLNCWWLGCYHCEPDIVDKPCERQDEEVLLAHRIMNETQQKVRFKQLYAAGWRMHSGTVVGRRPGYTGGIIFPVFINGKRQV